jgi:uncharacterized protein
VAKLAIRAGFRCPCSKERVGSSPTARTLYLIEFCTSAAIQPPDPTVRDDGQMAERDRDESGRPRSTRPRDALGRPLPPGSEGIPRIPDDLELTPAETLAYAQDLLDRGLAFNAHEVLEAAWKNGPDDEKVMWQALAQFAVGITHVQRGNVKGAITVLRRASGGLAGGEGAAPYAVDVAGLVDYADVLINDLAAGAPVTPNRLRPRLVVDRPR